MIRIFALFLFFSLYVTGCSGTSSPPTQKETTPSDVLVKVTVKPNPANILKKNDLYVTLNKKDGKAIEGANVKVDLTMKQMDHGDLSYTANPKQQGVYVVEIIPVMQGTWIANVTAQSEQKTTKAQYTFEAKR